MSPGQPPDHPARFVRAFRFAWDGLVYITRTQLNWKIHLGAGALAVITGWLLALPPAEFAILALTIGLVLAAEAANTAVEAAVDAAGHPPSVAAKHAKDAAAACVLIAAITAVAVAAFLFGPRLIALVSPN